MSYRCRLSLPFFLAVASAAARADASPVCSPAMSPGQCAEAQIIEISRLYGEYRASVAGLQDQLASAKSEIEQLKSRVTSLETTLSAVDKETTQVRKGGQACIFTHQGDAIPGWQYKGYFGVIQLRPFAAGSSDGFNRGAAFNPDWYWEHEDIYCAK